MKCKVCSNNYKIGFYKEKNTCSVQCYVEFRSKQLGLLKPNNLLNAEGNLVYDNLTWDILRKQIFSIFDKRCMCCGSKYLIHVDHIKPKALFPKLQYDLNNLQVLCIECNYLKSSLFFHDFRDPNNVKYEYSFKAKELGLIGDADPLKKKHIDCLVNKKALVRNCIVCTKEFVTTYEDKFCCGNECFRTLSATKYKNMTKGRVKRNRRTRVIKKQKPPKYNPKGTKPKLKYKDWLAMKKKEALKKTVVKPVETPKVILRKKETLDFK